MINDDCTISHIPPNPDDGCPLTIDYFDAENCVIVNEAPDVDDGCEGTFDFFDRELCLIVNNPLPCNDSDESTIGDKYSNDCLCLGCPNDVKLFTEVSRSALELSDIQSNKLDKLILKPEYLYHNFVQVGDLICLDKEGCLEIDFLYNDGPILFERKELEYFDRDNFVYFGELNSLNPDDFGYFHLIAKEGNIFGQININEDIFVLKDMGRRRNVLMKIDSGIYTENECSHSTDNSNNSDMNKEAKLIEQANVVSRITTCFSDELSVLVLFTSKAGETENPFNEAELLITQTNQIMAKSHSSPRFTLVGVQALSGFIESNNIRDDRDRLKIDPAVVGDPSAGITGLRNDFSADLVVLLTDQPLYDSFGTSSLLTWGSPDGAFAIVEITAAGGRFTFAHELFHNLGCKHNNDDEGAPLFRFESRGHGFRTGWFLGPRRRTVMHVASLNEDRIMHVSNPNVQFQDRDTGVADERDNAQQVEIGAILATGYRPGLVARSMNVEIDGPSTASSLENVDVCALIRCCDNPTSFQWQVSNDGFEYEDISQTQSCISLEMNLFFDLYVRVIVNCDDGRAATDTYFIRNTDNLLSDCHQQTDFKINQTETNEMSEFSNVYEQKESQITIGNIGNLDKFVTAPNPVSNELNIILEIKISKIMESRQSLRVKFIRLVAHSLY